MSLFLLWTFLCPVYCVVPTPKKNCWQDNRLVIYKTWLLPICGGLMLFSQMHCWPFLFPARRLPQLVCCCSDGIKGFWFHVYDVLHACMCSVCVPDTRDGQKSTLNYDGAKLPCGSWEPNLCPLKEQKALLTTSRLFLSPAMCGFQKRDPSIFLVPIHPDWHSHNVSLFVCTFDRKLVGQSLSCGFNKQHEWYWVD